MAKRRTKPLIIIVQQMVPHYRLPFFNQLVTSNPDLDIRVYHGESPRGENALITFPEKLFKTYHFQLFGYSLVLQPGLVMDILLARPDVLILEGTFGIITNFILLLSRKLFGLPTIIWAAGWPNPKISGLRLRLKSIFIRGCLFLVDGAIVYGRSAFDYLESHGFPKEKIIIAQNTIDIETIISLRREWLSRGLEIRKMLAWQAKKIVLYVGQILPIKRVKVLLEAFYHLHDSIDNIALLIVGDGEQIQELERYVNANQIPDVFFAGKIVELVDAYFAASDLFVLPGTGGLALNQAMASGLPVVATIADGTERDLIINGENGFIVPVDDVEALETAMADILSSPEHSKAMGDRSLWMIQEKASLNNMVEQYSIAIRRLISRRSSRVDLGDHE